MTGGEAVVLLHAEARRRWRIMVAAAAATIVLVLVVLVLVGVVVRHAVASDAFTNAGPGALIVVASWLPMLVMSDPRRVARRVTAVQEGRLLAVDRHGLDVGLGRDTASIPLAGTHRPGLEVGARIWVPEPLTRHDRVPVVVDDGRNGLVLWPGGGGVTPRTRKCP